MLIAILGLFLPRRPRSNSHCDADAFNDSQVGFFRANESIGTLFATMRTSGPSLGIELRS